MVAAAALVLIILVVVIVVMMTAAALMVVLVMVVMMVMAAAALVVIVVVLVAGHQLVHGQQEVGRLDDVEDLLRLQLIPGRGDDARALVVLAQQLHRLVDAILRRGLGAAENDGLGGLNLVDEELAEVFGVHAALGHVGHGGAARQLQIVGLGAVQHHLADVAELAHARGLDEDAVGMVRVDQLGQRVGKIAHQRAADAAGVQLRHLNAGILHEAAVDADLAVFILQQNHLFVAERAGEQLLNQRRLARSEKTGNNIYLRHENHPL